MGDRTEERTVSSYLSEVLGFDTGGVAACRELPYLEAVLLETMRVLPPAYMIGRCASKDTTLGGYAIPKGTTMLIACINIHR